MKAVNKKIKDQFIQNWTANIECTSNSNIYSIFKTKFERSQYILQLPQSFCKRFTRFRTRNHKLPVETGKWKGLQLSKRKCTLCDRDVGDEYYYLLICDHFKEERQKYLKPYYYNRPNTLKFNHLMNVIVKKDIRNLCYLIDSIVKKFNDGEI